MKTHRCKGSLEQKVSIRFDKKYGFLENELPTWNLRTLRYDSGWDTYSLNIGCKIKYCPFCAEELK